MFSSSPAGGAESMQLMYLLAITSASRSINRSFGGAFLYQTLSRSAR